MKKLTKTYRKTATIEAEQFDGSAEMINSYQIDYDRAYSLPFRIETPAGWVGMKVDDWIITDDNGKYWAIDDDMYKRTYAYASLFVRK